MSTGLELAQAMAVFGSKVTVLERGGQVMPREDHEASELVKEQMEADGVEFVLNTAIDSLEPASDGAVTAHIRTGDEKVWDCSSSARNCLCPYRIWLQQVGASIVMRSSVKGFGLLPE